VYRDLPPWMPGPCEFAVRGVPRGVVWVVQCSAMLFALGVMTDVQVDNQPSWRERSTLPLSIVVPAAGARPQA
jgi:hypothetical protein